MKLFFQTLVALPVKWNYTSSWIFTVRITFYNVHQTPIQEPGTEYMSITGPSVVILSLSLISLILFETQIKAASEVPAVSHHPALPAHLAETHPGGERALGSPCSLLYL